MQPIRVVIVANKWWEADPLCAVFIHDKARPAIYGEFDYPGYPARRPPRPGPNEPRPPDPAPTPRMTFECDAASVEVWCIEELMNPAEQSSSSREKARVLKPVATSAPKPPDLVIAFGTAGSREGFHVNGSVVVGRRVFIHDPYRHRSQRGRLWTPPRPDRIIDSGVPAGLLAKLDEPVRFAAQARFLSSPVRSADPMIMAGDGFISVGVVNVSDYADYAWADREAIAAFDRLHRAGQIGSVETTHGVVRECVDGPFLYVSGITDSEGWFDYEVTPRAYAQNFVGAHNAAVALAWLLPSMVRTLAG
jgi:hypothetical protein